MLLSDYIHGVNILSLDAKDVFIANHYNKPDSVGYNIRYRNGDINYRKFINTLPHSKELPKIIEVYKKVFRNNRFSCTVNGKEYTQKVINITFNYSNKEYNRITANIYVKFGYRLDELTLQDCVCVKDGELLAIQTDTPTEFPIHKDVLGKYFYYDDGMYKAKNNIKVLHSVGDLRADLYANGFVCDGVKYVRYKRSNGSSRLGKCLFIDENLYRGIFNWSKCGLTIKQGQEIDLPAFESYTALPLSSTIASLYIQPENILLVDDYEDVFTDRVMTTRIDESVLKTQPEEVQICNSIWDGQSLMDVSLFGEYQHKGFLLLRNRFFKSACFNTNLQQWFADNGITDVSQLNGYTRAKCIQDVKLVTTPSSIKYLKFGTFDAWLDNLDTEFGIVKYEKPTHIMDGKLVQTHYQLLNTLQLSQEDMEGFLKPSKDYLKALKADETVLRYHIKAQTNNTLTGEAIASKNDLVYTLLGINDKFCDTKLYYDTVRETIRSYKNNMKRGHISVAGNYSTLVGNPYEMLLQSIGKFDGTSHLGIGNIHSKRFAYNQKLLGSRSPHCCTGNVWVAYNKECPEIDTYFNFTKEILCINSIGENVLQRLNGCDFDSDSVLITDNPILLKAAIKNYDKWLVPTNMVEAKKIKRHYTVNDLTDLDIKTSENKIGEIINLAQVLTSIMWDNINNGASFESVQPIYTDICQLSVMSNIEIDKAKKEFDVQMTKELERLTTKYLKDENGSKSLPEFMLEVSKQKANHKRHKHCTSQNKTYRCYDTSMDYLEKSVRKRIVGNDKHPMLPLTSFIDFKPHSSHINKEQADEFIYTVRKKQSEINAVWLKEESSNIEKHEQAEQIYQDLLAYVSYKRIGLSTMSYLLHEAEKPTNKDIYRLLIKILFYSLPKDFLYLLRKSKTPVQKLKMCEQGDIEFFGVRFKKA